MEEKPVNIAVFGGPKVGRTSFIMRLVHGIFVEDQPTTNDASNLSRFSDATTSEIRLAERKCYIRDMPSDKAAEHSSEPDFGQDAQLLVNTDSSQDANLFVFAWDATRPPPIKEFRNRLYWMRARGIPIQEIPIIFVACKADLASSALTPKAIDDEIVQKFELTKVKYVITSAKEGLGLDKFRKAVDNLLFLSQEAQAVHALALEYQATKFAHTRAPRFSQLNASDISKKDPKELTDNEVEWLWLNWKSINDRKSSVSLWIEKRLACKFGIYDPAQPYTEVHRQQFDQRIQAKKTEEEERQKGESNSQQELQPLRKTDFAEAQQKFQKVHLLLVMLAAYETSKLVKLGCFFFACYRAKMNQFKIDLMATAKFLYDATIQNKTEQEVTEGIRQEWNSEIPKEVGRIVGLAR